MSGSLKCAWPRGFNAQKKGPKPLCWLQAECPALFFRLLGRQLLALLLLLRGVLLFAGLVVSFALERMPLELLDIRAPALAFKRLIAAPASAGYR